MAMTRREMIQHTAALTAAPLVVPSAFGQTPKPDPYADAKFVPGEPPPFAKDSFVIAVLPDTQNYSEKFPDTFEAQTKWVVENKATRNIQWLLHLGDITNRNTVPEWTNAAKAMARLDGHVPYAFCPGNHDYGAGGSCQDRTTNLNTYFPLAAAKTRPGFGGTYDKEPGRMENSFHTFAANGREFLVLALEFGPRADVVRWANEVLTAHAKWEAILITHAFIYFDETRYDWKKFGAKQKWNPHAYPVAKATNDDVSDGEDLWNNLVSKHENVILTLNGHVLEDGLGRVVTKTPKGRDVPQVLVNFQMKPKGGDGWLRLLEFKADGKTVEAYDYSPTRNECNVSEQNRFTLNLSRVGKASM